MPFWSLQTRIIFFLLKFVATFVCCKNYFRASSHVVTKFQVMLISMPAMEEIYKRCCGVSEDRDPDRDYIHPTRLINFLVGLRGKNETMAIGGPWSPSLDGPNPDKDPSVLIKTAIRTCKALTGIDLSSCTQWYESLNLLKSFSIEEVTF